MPREVESGFDWRHALCKRWRIAFTSLISRRTLGDGWDEEDLTAKIAEIAERGVGG